MIHFEEVVVGTKEAIGSFTFTKENIKAFARAYDPQPFHVDETAAAASLYGGLIASGWQVAAVWMKLNVARWQKTALEAQAAGRQAAEYGPSPGFRNMVWARPVRPGDTLSYWTTVTGKKLSATKPGWGVVTILNEAFDEAGAKAFAFDGAVFVPSRPGT